MSAPFDKCYDVLSPAKLAHVVLRTTKFEEMREYYKKFLGAGVEFENELACFLRLADLLKVWQQRKDLGIEPTWCINHGGTTSMYYEDPDGNKLEAEVDNYENPIVLQKFIKSDTFRKNPVGPDFDPLDLIKRLEAGEPDESVKIRIESGPRQFPSFVGQKV